MSLKRIIAGPQVTDSLGCCEQEIQEVDKLNLPNTSRLNNN